jgi:uncharacterized protein involved in exopolysaccharide biosynthesis
LTNQENDNRISEVFITLWISRRPIAYFVGIATAISIIISILLPNYYKSTAVLLPETEKSKLSALSGISDLASLAGLNVGEVSFVKLYPKIIASEAVLKNVLYSKFYSRKLKDSVTLIQFWEIDEDTPALAYETSLRSFRDQLEVAMDAKTNIVSISLETKEPQFSADVVNKITSELDNFIRTKRTTNASEQRKWIEARLSEVKNDLQRSENTLKDFRETNRRIVDSPNLLLDQERLIREVQINSALYVELKKQYEIVKIEEIKDIPIINVMDRGRPAARKERPKRAVIVATVFLLSVVMGGGYVYTREKYGRQIGAFVGKIRKEMFPLKV